MAGTLEATPMYGADDGKLSMTKNELNEDREQLRRALDVANIPTLLMVLTQMTGDQKWLAEPYLPTMTRGLDDHDSGDLPDDRQAEVRDAAFDAIVNWLDGVPAVMEIPDEETLLRMMSVCMGEPIPHRYAPMLHADLRNALEPPIPHVLPTTADERSEYGDVSASDGVVLVGAGISGMLAAIKLRELGIPFLLLEKNESVGGTWLTNVYPGAGVDTPSHLYSAVCAPGDWQHYFAKQTEIRAYLESIADRYQLGPHIKFGTEVLGAEYDEDSNSWRIDTQHTDGTRRTYESKYLVTAVGGFGRPVIPKIPGMDQFEGTLAHTASWPSGLDVAGKRIVVIGTGASGIQLVPALAKQGADVTVIQRTAQWIAPFEKFDKLVPSDLRHLMQVVPLYRAWYRLRLLWTFSDKIHPALQKDPDWPHPERAVNAINDGHRRYFTRYMQERLHDRPDLIEKSMPDYPPFGKRILLDNGWYEALIRPNVHLETTGVRELNQTGVMLDDGRHLDADIVVFATGFDVVRFLAPMRVVGRDGRELPR